MFSSVPVSQFSIAATVIIRKYKCQDYWAHTTYKMATYRTAISVSQHFQEPVMWSETVGLRTRPV